ncbi:MAG: S41 family peptidase [Alphaproteobacteria bacterium]|nr:S41 family peptidase [Alphaproteobacteria bacterium]
MKKYLMAALGGTLAGVLLTSQIAGPLIADEAKSKKSTYEQLDLFGNIFERIKSQYVEPVDESKLIEAAINGMLTSLDPHSSYLPPRDFNSMQVETKGEFGGLGIEVTQEKGIIKVVSPIDGTPAALAGIKSGDFITKVDGEAVQGLTLNAAVDLMRGPVGSEIVITVVRDGVADPFDVSIIRDTIKIVSVKARLEDNTVVLRISSFTDQTFPNLKAGLTKMVKKAGGMDKVDGFIIDLRNNPGGLLNQAILVSDAFLDKGEIVSTRGRDPANSDRFNAVPGDLAKGKPIVVLINGGSASASEIVTGALKDHRRAVIVGTKSFGKGSVQTIMPLQGNGAMRLTTARYYTPSGRSIQSLGIMPDILVEQRPPVAEGDAAKKPKLRSEADLRGSLNNDSLTDAERKQLEADRKQQVDNAKKRESDYQMSFALDIIRGLSVLKGAN